MADSQQIGVPAVYMRGGTSRALMFHARDLPDSRDRWDSIFAAALGSPDPTGRQLNGMGGGISSLSKVAVIGPPTRDGADVDFTFAQVEITGRGVSYRGNCGNISAAVGPFAVDEGLVPARGEAACVRIHNTNTGKLIRAEFPLVNGKAAVAGATAIAGVAGSGAAVRLSFLDPGGATTGKLLPTGRPADLLTIGDRTIEVSLVDATNPVVFVAADEVGLNGAETPEALADRSGLLALLDDVRRAGGAAMGLPTMPQPGLAVINNLPLVAIVSPATDEADVQVRMISAGQPHRAIPLTGAMCVAIAARLEGTCVERVAKSPQRGQPLLIGHAAGVLAVDAKVRDGVAIEAAVLRTARRLMEGRVLVPTSAMTTMHEVSA